MKNKYFRCAIAALVTASSILLIAPSMAVATVGAALSGGQQPIALPKGQKLIPSLPTEVEVVAVHHGKLAVSALQVSLAGQPTELRSGAGSAGKAVTVPAILDEAASPNIGTMILASFALMLWIAGRRLAR